MYTYVYCQKMYNLWAFEANTNLKKLFPENVHILCLYCIVMYVKKNAKITYMYEKAKCGTNW